MEEKELLNKFIEIERMKFRGGSGDDEFYTNQVVDYINKQKPLWLEFIKFIEKEIKGEKIMDKEIIEKEIEELISDLKIFIPKENYFLFKGRIGKLIDKALQLKEKSKGDVFVEHIQEHLDKGERGLKLYKIPEGVVGCAICGKTVDEIYEEYKNLKENKNG